MYVIFGKPFYYPKQVVIDNVPPQLTVTGALTEVVVQNYRPGRLVQGAPVLSGTITDGYAVQGVSVRVVPPGGGFYYDSATVICSSTAKAPVT